MGGGEGRWGKRVGIVNSQISGVVFSYKTGHLCVFVHVFVCVYVWSVGRHLCVWGGGERGQKEGIINSQISGVVFSNKTREQTLCLSMNSALFHACDCWLLAQRPSNMLVYLRDGSAQASVCAATLR